MLCLTSLDLFAVSVDVTQQPVDGSRQQGRSRASLLPSRIASRIAINGCAMNLRCNSPRYECRGLQISKDGTITFAIRVGAS
jgi:hypothetical protein